MFTSKKITASFFMLAVIVGFVSCKKYVPEDRDTVGPDSQFTKTLFEPVLGRTTFFNDNFYKGSTSFPATFTIINPRRRNGDAAPELTDLFPVKVWKKEYDGTEKSIAEIEAKRTTQARPLFEIMPHSGGFVMWAEAKSAFVKAQPDSGYLFDVEVSNSGGRRYFRNMRLQPFRERSFEPSNYNTISGQPLTFGISPSSIFIKGDSTERYLGGADIDVYARKLATNPSGNSITLKFLNKFYQPINPNEFNATDWVNLVHGFNMKKTATEVKYDVAFPVPLTILPTKYTTTDGGSALITIAYNRLGFGGLGEKNSISLACSIYEPGDWEIVFAFKTDNPKFSND